MFKKRLISQRAGFTLIEVMIAMVILSLSLVGLMQTFGNTAIATESLKRHHSAYWVGSNFLTEVRMGVASAGEGAITSSVTDMGGKEWFIDSQVVPSPVPQINKVLVEVFDKKDDEKPVVQINGYIANIQ